MKPDLTKKSDLSKQRRALVESTTQAGQRFAEYDDDGSMSLDFEEFLAMQPRRIRESRTGAEIKAWFDAADLNHDMRLSVDEFFQFSMGNAAGKYGARALDLVFKRYDGDGSGVLDSREFVAVAEEMGFGASAASIFRNLDGDMSGGITYAELINKLQETTPSDPATKALLMTMVWSVDEAKEEERQHALQAAANWKLKGRDVAKVRIELQALLKHSGCHVADLLELFDQDAINSRQIDDMEFLRVMRDRFNYKGPSTVVTQIFKMLDSDGTGGIGFDELFEFIRGRRHSLDRRNIKVRKMRLEPPPGSSFSLIQIAWDVETLRVLMQQMLARCEIGTAHLMSAWDRNGDFTISKREFLSGLRGFVRNYEHVKLWEHELRSIAEAAFVAINRRQGMNDAMGRHRASVLADAIEIVELERWLRAPSKRPPGKEVIFKKRGAHAYQLPADVTGARVATPAQSEASTLPLLRLSPGFNPWSQSLHVPWSRPLTSSSATPSPRGPHLRQSGSTRPSTSRLSNREAEASPLAQQLCLETSGMSESLYALVSPRQTISSYELMRPRLHINGVLQGLNSHPATRWPLGSFKSGSLWSLSGVQ